ncbi:FecR family protein [Sphingobacterium sp. MYb388]|uniref:FecR family protein n=1 Tax=Sphingobacterium sp. MYb388 TaxID=2745437 RepID=UPI0030A1031A
MDNQTGRDLLTNYLEDNSNELEKKVVEEWYAKQLLANISEKTEVEDYERIKSEMWAALAIENKRTFYRSSFLKVAAALFIIGSISVLYFFQNQIIHKESNNYVEQEILPGTTGATLTLSNGHQIKLSEILDGELTEEAGISISKSKDGFLVYGKTTDRLEKNVIHKLSTSNGETFKVILPDKSKVWLNAASSLTFDINFEGKDKREVKLEGEGYFEIAKDELPFFVETEQQKVQVTGTHFNINAYQKSNIKTTLLEGSVNVLTKIETKKLRPGQQSINRNGQLAVRKEAVETAVAWKNGYFTFDGDLKTAMAMLSTWYDVDVEFTLSAPMDLKLWGRISRNNTLAEVLRQIERTNKVHFNMKGRKIYVTQ